MNYEICDFCEHYNCIRINGIPYCDVEDKNKDGSYCLDAAEEYALWQIENREKRE